MSIAFLKKGAFVAVFALAVSLSPLSYAQFDDSSDFSLSEDEGFNPFEEEENELTPEEIENDIREQAFSAALTGLLPLRPTDIRRLLEHYDRTQQAVEIPIYPYPEPEIVIETISLDPGSKPPVVKLAAGHVTSLEMLDITGAPWPIASISWAGNFQIIEPDEGSNFLPITPMSHFAHGNLIVYLHGLKMPVIFTLETHRDVVQYRFDARIPEFGPNAKAPLIDSGSGVLSAGNSTLSAFLEGVPPSAARRYDVSGVDGRTTVYRYDGATYVRTPLTLLSPGWNESISSADGMNVYSLTNAPVLLLSDNGQVVHAQLTERETLR